MTDRDFEPGRHTRAGPLMRRFWSLLGVKSGRERLESEDGDRDD